MQDFGLLRNGENFSKSSCINLNQLEAGLRIASIATILTNFFNPQYTDCILLNKEKL